MLTRRDFIALSAIAPLAVRLGAAQRKPPVGIELYSVRDELAKDPQGTVRAVARIGYEIVEFYSPYLSWTPESAKEMRKLLDDLGIRCLSTHNGADALAGDTLKKAIELNQIIGSKTIVMASPGKVVDLVGWKTIADRLTAAAETLRPFDMFAGYHNHGLEWRPVDGTRPMDLIAANTPKAVTLQLDVGTCVEEKADPIAWIKQNPGRIRSIHCKDWGAGPDRGYAVVFGEGDSPWAGIFAAAESVGGVEYYLIEQEAGPANEQLQRAERCLANWKKMKS
jgi:sugar phosphate isomerase/epimerase